MIFFFWILLMRYISQNLVGEQEIRGLLRLYKILIQEWYNSQRNLSGKAVYWTVFVLQSKRLTLFQQRIIRIISISINGVKGWFALN